jgi:four helix bundle protein
MKNQNVIVDKSYAFALEVMGVARQMRAKKEYDLASQFWRSGTSVGANVEESQAAQSRADFISKMSIAAKEARESRYWLRLAVDDEVLPDSVIGPAMDHIEEIMRILTSIIKSSKDQL